MSEKKHSDNLNDSSKAPSGGGGFGKTDINCDMGEGIGNDKAIMPFISSANIACGYHAGDEKTIWQTVELALQQHVRIGAHVSFLDRKNFGRTEMTLDAADIYELVQQQLILMNEITDALDATLYHVKPHGALYNMSAKDASIAKIIAAAVKDYNDQLVLFGLSNSHSISEAKKLGLKTASEVFADRTYQDDGSLTSRSQPNALIEDSDTMLRQVMQMIREGTVTTVNGKTLPILAETICIHGDGKQAAAFARLLHEAIQRIGE